MIPFRRAYLKTINFFLFVLFFFTLDSAPLLYTFSKSDAFNGVIVNSVWSFGGIFVYFFLKILLLLVSLSIFLSLLTHVFKVRHIKTFFILIVAYVYCYNLIEQPSIFDDILGLNFYIQKLNSYLSYTCLYVLIASILFFLNANYILSKQFSHKNLILNVTTNTLLLVFFFYAQAPLKKNETPVVKLNVEHVKDSISNPNVIVLGIDSLRADTYSLISKGTTEFLLNKSLLFRSSITPVANTRPAYNSILSGKNPPKIEQRFPLKRKVDERLIEDNVESPLLDFKKGGYSTHYILDDASYNRPEEGGIFDSVDAPENSSDLRKYVFPILLRSRLIFAFFNNPFGNFIFPGIYANFAYTYAYKLPGFTNKVIGKIDELKKKKDPFFLMVHTSALHFPGNFRYPYYSPGGANSKKILGFGSRAPYLSAVSKSLPVPGVPTSEYYPTVYRNGVEMVRDHFLNPILNHISQINLLENTIVVIFSDHGETFWRRGEIPRMKLPNHGTFLLGSDHSPMTFLSIYNPKNSKIQKIDDDFPVVKLITTLCSYAKIECRKDSEESVVAKSTGSIAIYSETGMFPLKQYDDQFYFDNYKFSELFTFDSEGDVFLADWVARPTIIQKNRVIYSYPYRQTLYLAEDGYRFFLCNFIEDVECSINLVNKKPQVQKELFGELLRLAQNDLNNQFLPPLKINRTQPMYADYDLDKITWSTLDDHLKLIFAISRIKRSFDLGYPIELLLELTSFENNKGYIKNRGLNVLRKLCRSKVLDREYWGKFKKDKLHQFFSKADRMTLSQDGCFSTEEISLFHQHPPRANSGPSIRDIHIDNAIERYRQTGDKKHLNVIEFLHVGTRRKKILQSLTFFHELRGLNLPLDSELDRVFSFLRSNYQLSLTLSLRDEFNIFWKEAFLYFKEKYDNRGVYRLLFRHVFFSKIPHDYFLQQILPFISSKNLLSTNCLKPRNLLATSINRSYVYDLKENIVLRLLKNVFCVSEYNDFRCKKINKKIEGRGCEY